MKISARVENQQGEHKVAVNSDGREQSISIAPKAESLGSSVNGGELLFLALATCYCNDLYREARKRGVEVKNVQVEVSGEFTSEGGSASEVRYRAYVEAKAPREEILALMQATDAVAEIQNTLRTPTAVVLTECEAREV